MKNNLVRSILALAAVLVVAGPGMVLAGDGGYAPRILQVLGPGTATTGADYDAKVTFTDGSVTTFPGAPATFAAAIGTISASGVYTKVGNATRDAITSTYTANGVTVTGRRIVNVQQIPLSMKGLDAMKLNLALAASALALFGASAANAQLSVVLDNPNQVFTSALPGSITFDGTIFNTGSETITLDSESLSAPAGVSGFLPSSDLVLGIFPYDLGPGDSLTGQFLFELTGQAGWTTGFSGTYAAGGSNAAGAGFLGVANYSVSVVPEPGSAALLLGSMVGGSALFLRRRRK